ncbi:MAG: AbrB/MazE/SpoVT family DNA-binding domain-containing protein [Verrucomicrobiales bacterium]
MKITVKGQVTVPIALRERFGLRPGTNVKFAASEGRLPVKPRKPARQAPSAFDRWLAKAAGSAKPRLSTSQLMVLTRDATRYQTYFLKVKLIFP